MKPLIDEILHCIIHKAVTRDAALARKRRARDAYTEMGTEALLIGPRMTRMRRAFVQHLQLGGLKTGLQLLLYLAEKNRARCSCGHDCLQGVAPGLICLFR